MAKKRKRSTKGRKIKNLKTLNALLNPKIGTMKDVYKAVHPNASDSTAERNSHKVLTPEVMEAFREAMQVEQLGKATRSNLEHIFFIVVARWMNGKESTKNMLEAAKQLTRLVKEFSEKVEVSTYPEDEKELDEQIKRLAKRYGGE